MSDFHYYPQFLNQPDPDEPTSEQRQRQYAQRGSDDRLPRHYLTMEDAMEMANELARVVLPEGAE